MKTVIRMVSVTLMTALLTANAWAQVSQLRGRLVDADQGIPGIEITLERADGGGNNVYVVSTDDRGDFTHAGIAPATYTVSFQIDETIYNTGTVLSPGDMEITLDLDTLQYQGVEFSRNLGAPETVFRDIRTFDAGTRVIAAPRSQDEAAAREEAASSAAAVRAAFDAGVAAMAAEDFPEAIAQFSLAASGDGAQQVIFGNLGLAYERSQMWEEAVAAYGEAQFLLELMEDPPEGLNYFPSLTLAHAMLGNVDSALENAEKGAEIDPAGAGQAFYNIGAVLTNQGDVNGANQAFARAVELDPENAEAVFQLAVGQLNNEATIPDAVPLLERYLELAPEGPNAAAAQGLLEFARQ